MSHDFPSMFLERIELFEHHRKLKVYTACFRAPVHPLILRGRFRDRKVSTQKVGRVVSKEKGVDGCSETRGRLEARRL